MTEEDNLWNKALYLHRWPGYQEEHVPPLLTAFPESPGFQRLDPEGCLDALAASVSPVMGRVSRHKSKVICRKWIGDWKIVTEFTLVRREEKLTFVYDFIRRDGGRTIETHPAQGPFPRTLLFFFGLGFTTVHVPSKVDGERMAKVMAKLAEYFVAQADPLFEGLGIKD